MGIFKSKRLSAADLSLSLGAIAFPMHVWAIINILAIFPAWVLRLSIWELAGVVSYALVDALLESCILWAGLVVLSLILPARWLSSKFLALSSALAWLLAAWAALIQFTYDSLLQWGAEQIIPGLVLVAFSFGLVYWCVQRYARVESWIKKFTQRLAVLTYLYVTLDVLGLVVVILRNL